MNSEEFFSDTLKLGEGNVTADSWKGKGGIYVLTQPLIYPFYGGKAVYKVGFAADSLYNRLRNYKTMYGKAPFFIECIFQTSTRTIKSKGNQAHLTEKQIHTALDKKKLGANFINGKREGEWFFNLEEILKVILTIRADRIGTVSFSENWIFYVNPKYAKIVTRSMAKEAEVGKIEDVKSTLPAAIDRTKLRRKTKGNLTVGGKAYVGAFETGHNETHDRYEKVSELLKHKLT